MPTVILNSGVSFQVDVDDADRLRAAVPIVAELVEVTVQQGNSLKTATADIPMPNPRIWVNPRAVNVILR